jgi:hypothetical protein
LVAKTLTWDQIVADDKLRNASFFIVGKDPMVQSVHRMIPSTPSGICDPVLTPSGIAILNEYHHFFVKSLDHLPLDPIGRSSC